LKKFSGNFEAAESYMHVVKQPRSAWTWEVELRPLVERF
jgi:hypothetical protein